MASALCYLADSLPLLLAARSLQALGAGAALSVSSALVRAIYPARRIGQGLAINGVVVSTSNALAPTIGGAILSVGTWPYIFIAAVPFAVLSLALARFLPVSEPRDRNFDWSAAGLCALAFGLITAGLEMFVHRQSPSYAAILLAAGCLATGSFVRRELRQRDPILPLALLRQNIIALSVIGAFTAFTASMTVIVTLPFQLHRHYGFTPVEIGSMVAAWPATVMVVAPLSGLASDRFTPAKLGACGMAISIVGLIALASLPASPHWCDVAWPLCLSGAGFGMFLAPNGRLILTSAPRHRAASAGGLIATTRLSGQLLGATVAAGLLTLGPDGVAFAPMLAACLCLVAAICSLARRRPSAAQDS